MEPIYVALDLETTGLDVNTDRIIEVGAVKFRGETVLETYQRFVNPRIPLPMKVARLTGIAPEDLTDAPTFNAIGAEFSAFIGSYAIVGHSVQNDVRFLAQAGLRISAPAYDTFDLASLLLSQLPNYSLGTIADHLGIGHPDAHRALADADVTRQVFVALLDRLAALSVQEIHQLAQMTERLNWSVAPIFGALAKRRVKTLWQDPAPFRPAQALTIRPAPLEPTGSTTPLDLEEIGAAFGPDGTLAAAFPGYEPRAAQAHMAQAVAAALNDNGTLLIEAPTGTGKSMAYLWPAARFARERGERVVVSTNTINLQDQLATKDIPALEALLSPEDDGLPPLRSVLLKGRGNYLCLKRYEEQRAKPALAESETRTLVKIQLWLPNTATGDRAELMLMRDEAAAWSEVNVNPDLCARQSCPLYNECFYYKARAEAEAAHIVVVNHALLLSDVRSPGLIPRYDHLIIDEAHNLEEVATDQLGFSIDEGAFFEFLDDIYLAGGPRIVQGLLADWPESLRLAKVDPREKQRLQALTDELIPRIEKTREHAKLLFAAFNTVMQADRNGANYDPRLRIVDRVRRQPAWSAVEKAWEELGFLLQATGDDLKRFQAILEPFDQRQIADYDTLMARVKGLATTALTLQEQIDQLIFGDAGLVAWLSHDQRRNTLALNTAPLDVGPLLHEKLWTAKRAVVLASATLAVDRSFAYPRARLGLEEADELALESPFDYRRSTLVYLPTDMPEPNERQYLRKLQASLIDVARATKGRLLALFTANQAMRQIQEFIQEPLEQDGIITLAQGMDGSRRTLLQRFKHEERTVLLGAASFWEGVDIVGEALSVLAITKLPFSVPNDPVISARSEQFEDAFTEYSVPQAILRFKQGFGRLIRSRDDRGVVVVYDRRLLSKRYGQTFINSLPDCTVVRAPLAKLPEHVERWLSSEPDASGVRR